MYDYVCVAEPGDRRGGGEGGPDRGRGEGGHPLSDLWLCEVRIGLLSFLPRIHTEEVKGGLVGLGRIGVL